MRTYGIRLIAMLSLLLATVLSGCSLYYSNREDSGPFNGVFIDNPLDGASLGIAQSVSVQGRAATGPEVSALQMWLQVDGHDAMAMAVQMTSQGEGGKLWFGMVNWVPGVPGDHELRIRAVTTDTGEEATSESITVHVSAQGTPAPIQMEPTLPPPLVVTPLVPTAVVPVTVTPAPTRAIWFQADPPAVRAGGCTTLSWKTEPNVRSIALNGQSVEWYGSQQVCNLCTSQTYTLEVVWPDGARDVRTLTVNVTGSCVTPTPSPTRTPTPTPTAFPQATINFWADATTIPAGTCTTIHWQTANVQAVYFNGQGVVGEGSHQTCPCNAETHTLDVVLRDGSHDVRTLTINVTGSCVTPTPARDTTPPPAPVSLKPGSTDPGKPQDLGSCSPVVLRWEPVTDQGGSGLQGYRVSLQRNNNGQWQSLEPYFIIYEPSVDVTRWLGAGWDYRWNVWAIDNAGNHGTPSIWRYFRCPLQ